MTSKTTTSEAARSLVGDTDGGTSPERGAELHQFVREQKPQRILELGFAWGVSAVYFASALEANGSGQLTSVDMPFERRRAVVGQDLLQRGGLQDRVDVVLEEGGYNYFLLRKLREQLRDGRIEPLYDMVFLDGAHTWPDDALAFALVDRLLKPGGWILLDDLDWLPGDLAPEGHRDYPHVRQIFDLLLVPDASYDQFYEDGTIARARKAKGAPEVRVVYKQDVLGSTRTIVRYARTRLRRR